MINKTTEQLRGMGLIEDDDIIVACNKFSIVILTSCIAAIIALYGALTGFIGGVISGGIGIAIGYAVAVMMARYYIIAANKTNIRIFNIDKKGNYLGDFIDIRREDIVTASVSNGSGIMLKTTAGRRQFFAKKKFRGRFQSEYILILKSLFESQYGL